MHDLQPAHRRPRAHPTGHRRQPARRPVPRGQAMFLDGKEDLTAFADFPTRHWKKIPFTNRLERINREIKRRTDVVHAFPN
ncbi:transposase [Streptomyces sp. RLB3-6]|uniref:transposase n=1 Tax=Streptomyces sp. RLB3-6 TaxID=2594457 RepID=UPI0031FC2D87